MPIPLFLQHDAPIPNTFGLNVQAQWLARLQSPSDLVALQQSPAWQSSPRLAIGSGSNVLFTKPFAGLVIRWTDQHYHYKKIDDQHSIVCLGAGCIWHDVVMQTLKDGYHGLENLVAIPGTVGAAPIQNIGAYGRELSDCLIAVEAINLNTLQPHRFNKQACKLGYRTSIFRQPDNPWLITQVQLRLEHSPQLCLRHEQVKAALANAATPTSLQVAQTIAKIRDTKLPNPDQIGNAGSFFKNPIISQAHHQKLQKQWPNMPAYAHTKGIKIPAAWLIEQAHWRGHRQKDAGVHSQHALVLVNHGMATGCELWALAQQIQQTVLDLFAIELEPEVRII